MREVDGTHHFGWYILVFRIKTLLIASFSPVFFLPKTSLSLWEIFLNCLAKYRVVA